MTCPDLDRLVDDAVAGLPGAQERLAAHADACAACLAEADCAHAPVSELALLADAHCPPDVVAAALAEIRHIEAHPATAHRADTARPARLASDRPAARDASPPSAHPTTARPVWTRRIAVGIAFAAAMLVLRAVWPEPGVDTPRVAGMPEQAATPRSLGFDAPATPQPVEIAAAPTPAPPSVSSAPAPEPATAPEPARTVPAPVAPARIAPVPQTDAPDPVRDPAPAVDPAPVVDPSTVGMAVPGDDLALATPADSAAARSDLLLALAIVGRAQRTADAAVTSEMRRVSDALEPARTL